MLNTSAETAVAAIAMLGDNALQSHDAGLSKHDRAASLDQHRADRWAAGLWCGKRIR